MYIYIYMYVSIYIYTYIYIYVYVYLYMHICMNIYIYICCTGRFMLHGCHPLQAQNPQNGARGRCQGGWRGGMPWGAAGDGQAVECQRRIYDDKWSHIYGMYTRLHALVYNWNSGHRKWKSGHRNSYRVVFLPSTYVCIYVYIYIYIHMYVCG